MSLTRACREALMARLGNPPAAADVRVGVFYTAVRLDTGHVGLAYTPRDLADTVCCPRTAAAAPPAGACTTQSAYALAAFAEDPLALKRTIGIATLNALSALAFEQAAPGDAEILLDTDALDLAAVQSHEQVVLVGAFPPFIKALAGRTGRLRIIEKHREALKPHELPLWCAPDDAPTALASADVVVITGSVLVEGGLENFLAHCGCARLVMLAGPTASLWPAPFFNAGIDVLAGVRIEDPAQVLRVVSEGGAGYFFRDCTRKLALRRRVPRAARVEQLAAAAQT